MEVTGAQLAVDPGNVTSELRDALPVKDASNEEKRELEKITGAISNLLH